MPFVQVQFNEMEQAAAMDRRLHEAIAQVDRPVAVARKLLGLPSGKGWVRTLQVSWCVFLSALIVISWAVSLCLLSTAYACFLSSGLSSFLLLVFWGRPNQQFYKFLKASSNGVGLLRHVKRVETISNRSFVSSAVAAIFFLVLLTLSTFDLFPNLTPSDLHLSLKVFLSLGVVLSTVAIPPAHCIFFSFVSRIAVEYEALDYDFRRDVHASQLPVCRHYFHAHRGLLKMFYAVKGPFELWVSSCLLVDVIVLFSTVYYSFTSDLEGLTQVWTLFLNGIMMSVAVLHLLFLLLIPLRLRMAMKNLKSGVLSLLVGRLTLHEQVYSLCSAFLHSLNSSLPSFLLFGLFPLRRSFPQLFLPILSVLLLVFVLRIKD